MNCVVCGAENATRLYAKKPHCTKCHGELLTALANSVASSPAQSRERDAVRSVMLTTSNELAGFRIVRTIDIVTAECAYGMNAFRDMFAGLTDVFGGRSQTTQRALREARETCLLELRREAVRVGSNAVIAVDLDYSEFSGQGKSMLFLVASGTAVQVEPLVNDVDKAAQRGLA